MAHGTCKSIHKLDLAMQSSELLLQTCQHVRNATRPPASATSPRLLSTPSVLQLEYLTSGYFEHNRWGPSRTTKSYNKRRPRESGVTKCSHGGTFDASRTLMKNDGINKDSPIERCMTIAPELSYKPYTLSHAKAARVAIEATVAFLQRVRNNVSEEQFGAFLGISSPEPVSSLGLVIDTTGTTAANSQRYQKAGLANHQPRSAGETEGGVRAGPV